MSEKGGDMSNNSLKNKIGIDRCKFDLQFNKQQKDNSRVVKIISKYNYEFGEIAIERGKWIIELCLPRYFNQHNAVPFKMEKVKCFDEILECVYNTINNNFDGPFKTSLTSIEMNITEVYADCDYESFFLLLSHSMLDETKQNARYEIRTRKTGLRPITTGIKTRVIKGRFCVKAYDKRRQVLAEYGTAIEYSPIRIEVVFSKLALTKFFDNQRSLKTVMSKSGLNTLIDGYIQTMSEILDGYVTPYLQEIQNSMVTYMKKCNSIRDTYCEFKEVVYDIEQLRMVLKIYYNESGKNDSSRKIISDLNKRFTIPKGMLSTLEQIQKSLKV